MRTNKILENMKVGVVSMGCAYTHTSTTDMELIGMAGFDFVYLDGEHGTFSLADLDDLVRVAEMYDVTTWARVPNLEASTIGQYLDRGIQGIEGPHVSTRADAERLVEACYYSPIGNRSLGAGRAANYLTNESDTEYMAETNSQMLVTVLLEDVEALDNLEEMVKVDGIHTYHVGPKDMAGSLGYPGDIEHPKLKEVEAEVARIVKAGGRKLTGDVLAADRFTNLFLTASREYISNNRGQRIGA